MKFLKIFGILLGALFSTYGYSSEKILIPTEYESFLDDGEHGYTVHRDYINNTNQVVFMFSPYRKAKDDVWFTNCFNNKYMGIEVFSCVTQNKNLKVLTNDNGKAIVFNLSKKTEQKQNYQINYKIDNLPIRTINHSAMLPSVDTNFLILDLIKGKKMVYSWETTEGYSSESISLIGFKESMEFATKMLKLNSQ